ncbi:MAG: protease inhibitor I42 family protein [Methylococcales bacterium]|nr:protease inhibitor I42 family protein [Methylococcales bacterium]
MRLLLLFVALLLAACVTTKSSVLAQTIVLTEQDNNKPLSVSVGERFVIRFSENQTTGYVWAIDGQTELLVLQSSDYVSDMSPINEQGAVRVGGGGKRTFTFAAQKSGATILKLRHWRPWEGDASIVDTFSIPVKIEVK